MKAFIAITLFCLLQFSLAQSDSLLQSRNLLRPEKALLKGIKNMVLAPQNIQFPSSRTQDHIQVSQDILLTEVEASRVHDQETDTKIRKLDFLVLLKYILHAHPHLLESLMIYQSDAPKEDLGLFFHGFLEQANVTDSDTIMQCYNDRTADITLQFLGAAISSVANDQWTDIPILIAQYNRLIPNSVKNCLAKNEDLIKVYKIYGITAQKLIDIFAAISKYSLQDIKKFHAQAVQEDIIFQSGDYEQVGKDIGQLLLNVFNPKHHHHHHHHPHH